MVEPQYQKTAVIVPTYNEAENIKILHDSIRKISPEILIVAVDDNSPDGTSDLVETLRKKDNHLFLIQRPEKSGRGGAVMAGMKLCLEKGMEYIFEMDADMSHDPKDIPHFLANIDDDQTVVIGSKHLKGSTILEWGFDRILLSRLANIFARIMLGIPLTDYTNGYRCYPRKALEAIDFSKVNARGYVVLSEMAYQLHHKGFKLKEIPIIFLNRRRGLSNLTHKEVTGAISAILQLRWQESKLKRILP